MRKYEWVHQHIVAIISYMCYIEEQLGEFPQGSNYMMHFSNRLNCFITDVYEPYIWEEFDLC